MIGGQTDRQTIFLRQAHVMFPCPPLTGKAERQGEGRTAGLREEPQALVRAAQFRPEERGVGHAHNKPTEKCHC